MPRRKSQPNPPNKRVKGEHRPLNSSIDLGIIGLIPFNSRVIDNNGVPKSEFNGVAGERKPEGGKTDAEGNKYLHKKFKKVATLEEAPREEHHRKLTELLLEDRLRLDNHNNEEEEEDDEEGRATNHQGHSAKHVCPYCQLVCAKPSVLEKHIRAHTNERPYPCDPCGIAFKTKSNLYKHCRSRAHTMKMDEGEQQRSRHSSEEEDEEYSEGLEAPPEHPAPPIPTSTTATNNNNNSNAKIYKPKFHKAAFYAESSVGTEDGDGVSEDDSGVGSGIRSQLQDPVTSPRLDDGSALLPLTALSSPSTEYIHRHINKLISDNKAIVGEEPAVWTWHKKHSRHSKDESPSAVPQLVHRPVRQTSHVFTEQSPRWNGDSYHAAGIVKTASLLPSRLALALLGPSSGQVTPILEPLNLSTPKFETKSETKPRHLPVPQPPLRSTTEGSIIKNILLKYKPDDRLKDLSLRRQSYECQHCGADDSDCFCKKGPKRSRVHQREYTPKKIKTMAWDGPLALGPRLGKTPLVDSYRKDEDRYLERTAMPSDPCRSPVTSVQMFGGEVHIRDTPSGETKTLRIEPSNKRDTNPSYMEAAVELAGGRRAKTGRDPQVLTISKTLHSVGGTVLQTQSELRSPESLGVRSFPVQVEQTPFPLAAALNPLTSITCFNPLTLPAAPALKAAYSGGGVVQQQAAPRSIPHVPGIPGPNTLLPSVPFVPLLKKSPSASSSVIVKPSDSHDRFESPPPPSPGLTPVKVSAPDSRLECEDFAAKRPRTSEDITKPALIKKETSSALPTVSLSTMMMTTTTTTLTSSCVSSTSSSESLRDKKFVRPTSLPLRPGTYTPKRHVALPPSQVSLVSPETPRPRKAYVQLYLNGHAYTYLGLKCSTRLFFCTLNKPQPMYVPLSPEHNKVSMYSNWKVCSESNPNPLGLNPGSAMAQYDSRNRTSSYTVANGNKQDVITHSTYAFRKENNNPASKNSAEWDKNDSEKQDGGLEGDASKRVKVCDGGVESNEDYIYVRGRGRGRYMCEECGIRCKKPSMLKKHRRTHTDSRPYNCKYCAFSFKTKGNLTKHMKSKAHFKKCIESDITPVLAVVDNFNIIEENTEDHQNNFHTADEYKEGSDDETEDEDDGDEDEDTEDEEEGKIRLAARSLLSLSEVTPQTVKMQFVSAGLDSGRPRTYPYTLASTQRSTPTREQGLEPSCSVLLPDKDVVSIGGSPLVRVRRDTSHSESDSETTRSAPDSIPAGLERSVFPSGDSLPLAESAKPMDLSNKPTGVVHTPVITSVSGPASLLATICSTTERLPVTPTADIEVESNLLQQYLKERAAMASIIKQHQTHHLSSDPSPSPATTPVSPSTSAPTRTLPETHQLLEKAGEQQSPVRQGSSPPATSSVTTEGEVHGRVSEGGSGDVVSSGVAEWAAPASAKESALGILADANKKAAASAYHPHTPSSPNKKLKAEFLPPSSAPPPGYVSILEDGKSMCSICNKVFNKPSQLRLHVNIHYIERPFRCDACAISFRTKGHLQKHQRSVSHLNKVNMNSTFGTPTTSNPRPFKCDDCKIAFRIHGHLAKHLRSKLHIMKLECIGKLPFGTYADLERSGMNMNDIDTTDCDHSLDSLLTLAQKLYEKDPSKLNECSIASRGNSETGADAYSSSEEDEVRPRLEIEDKGVPAAGLEEGHSTKSVLPGMVRVAHAHHLVTGDERKTTLPPLEDGGSNSSSSSSSDSGVDASPFVSRNRVINLYPKLPFEPKLGGSTTSEDPVR